MLRAEFVSVPFSRCPADRNLADPENAGLWGRLSTCGRLPIGLLLVSLPLLAQHWTTLKAPGFEIYTTKEQPAAIQELQYLQTIQSFFDTTQPFGKLEVTKPVQVITFRSRAEFAPYAFRAEGGGYYLHTHKNDYILIGDSGIRDRSMVAHEFTHMVVTRAGLKLPIWLNEGLADFYSTVELTESQATVGRPPTLYMETMHTSHWMPWETLFAVDAASSAYSVGENLRLLYSQSWALTHMLELDETYAPRFPQFLRAVSGGQGARDALQSIYHKNLAQINDDLSSYLKRRKLPVRILDCAHNAPPAPAIGEGSSFDVELGLATILASKPGSGNNEGREKLADLSARYPDRPEAEEEIGMLALQQNKKDEARHHFAIAVQRHSTDPEVLFDDAVLEKEAGAKYAPVSALFHRALELQPDMEKARLELGLLAYEDLQYQPALEILSNLTSIPEDSRFEVYYAMAQCYSNVDDTAKAALYVKKAMQSARNDDQKEQASDLLESIQRDQETPASAPAKPQPTVTNARGTAKSLDCSSGQKRLTLDVEGHEMTFDISDPHLVVRHPSDDYTRWTCGPLKAETLTIVYRTDGKALELVF
jgi:tetratricopeptide (TPR) repeat protein